MFCEIAEGSVTRRNIIVPVTQLPQFIERAQASSSELYRSLYEYDEEITQHMTVRRTVKNYRGKYYLPKIVFDIDKGDNTNEHTIDRVLSLVDDLHLRWQIPDEAIAIFFSGTGYHVAIPDVFHFEPANDLPDTVAATIEAHFSAFELDPIYNNATRIIRVAGTINNKSSLYKVKLSPDELSRGFQEVRLIAQTPRAYGSSDLASITLPNHSDAIVSAPRSVVVNGLVVDKVSGPYTAYVPCMQKLYERGEKKGSRHNDILRLASAFRRGGLPLNAVEVLLKQWAPTLEPYAVHAAVSDVYTVPLQYGCDDSIMAKHCMASCVYAKAKNLVPRTTSALVAEAEFVEYMHSTAFNEELNLKDFLRLDNDFFCRKGDVVVVLGDTGIGKSALVQHLCVESSQMKVLYLSLEMGQHLTFRRLVQAKHGLTKEEVFAHYNTQNNTLGSGLSHITITTAAPKLDVLGRIIADSGATLVVVDTLDCIEAPGDMNSKIDDIVLGLISFAEKYKCIILPIHHISKFAAAEKDLTVHSGRGSATLEHKASMVIGIKKISDVYRKVFTLKSRDEIPFDVVCEFDYNTFRYKRIADDGGRLTWVM